MVADEGGRDQISCMALLGQRFRHRHREIRVSEFVDLFLPAPLAVVALLPGQIWTPVAGQTAVPKCSPGAVLTLAENL